MKQKDYREQLSRSTESLPNKGKSKREIARNDKNNCLICFLRGQPLDSKAKSRGIGLNI